MVRLGVRRLLYGSYEVEEAADAKEGLDLITALGEFDVAVVGLGVGRRENPTGIKAIGMLRKARPGLGIVAHGAHPASFAATEAIEAGATAYVAKSSPPEALARAIEAAADSERFVDLAGESGNGDAAKLTRRQRETLQHYADGRTTDEVARQLGVTTETVRTHAKAAIARLDARDRAHAVAIGLRASLIE